MSHGVRTRGRKLLSAVLGMVVALGATPLVVIGTTGRAGAACATVNVGHWISGYTVVSAGIPSPSGLFDEGDLSADAAGNVTGVVTSLNGNAVAPNVVTGTVTCDGVVSGTLVGITGVPITFSAVVTADGDELIGGSWASGSIGGAFSSARVVRSEQATAATALTTDTGNTGATSAEPLQVGITSPNSGTLEVQIGKSENPALAGYQLVNQVVHITAPAATPEAPLEFQFVLDGSALLGAPASEVQVFRNGTLVADCAPGAGSTATPSPCVAGRVALAGGDVQVTVRSAAASVWYFGINANRGGLRIFTAALPPGTVGTKYSALLTALGGTGPYKWKKVRSKLPGGLKFKGKTGEISGTPKRAGTFTINLQVKDAARVAATKSVVISVH